MIHVTTRDTSPRILRLMSKIPWTALIILFLVITTLNNVQMQGVIGYIFLLFGLFVLFVEFFKSGDISTAAFFTDLVIAVASVIAGAALMTAMVMARYELTFFHWYGAAIVVADAILSPFNSFRTAKRNVELGGIAAE